MGGEQAGGILELVVFELSEGATREQLLATVEPVSEWIKSQPGFISRELSYAPEADKWIDMVRWQSLQDAHAAAELAMDSETCAPMFALINFDTMLMLHGEPAVAAVLEGAGPA